MKIFVQVDVRASRHRKLVGVGYEARGLWMDGLLYAKDFMTDGFVPDEFLLTEGPKALEDAKKLVESGAWEKVEGGYAISNFLEHNPSREEIQKQHAELTQSRSVAGKRGMSTRWGAKKTKKNKDLESDNKPITNDNKPITNHNSESYTESESDTESDTDLKTLSSREFTPRACATPPEVPPAEASSPASGRKPRSVRKLLPDDFAVSSAIQELARKEGLPDPHAELPKFRDYWLSRGERMADWEATFRNWLRRSAEFARKARPSGTRIVQQPAAKFEGSWEDYSRGYRMVTMPSSRTRRIDEEDYVPWLDERDRLKAAGTPADQAYFEAWFEERKRKRKEAGILTEAEKLQVERDKRSNVTPIRRAG